jgi:3-hydroxybutyrate dehydrogenase
VQRQIEARATAEGILVQQARKDLLRENQPMLDFTTPEQLGGLAVFLCSEAAKTITGAALSADAAGSCNNAVILQPGVPRRLRRRHRMSAA